MPKFKFNMTSNWQRVNVSEEIETQLLPEPISMRTKMISYDSYLNLTFSENFLLLDLIEITDKQNMSLQLFNELKDKILKLTYRPALSKNQSETVSKQFPALSNFTLVNFNQTGMSIKLEFENPLYVSSTGVQDSLDFQILIPTIFRNQRDTITIVDGFTIKGIPISQQFVSVQELLKVESQSQTSGGSLLVTFLIPFLFMLFKSMGMAPVWSLYNFMQLLSNFTLLPRLLLPSNARFMLEVLYGVSFF